MEIQLTYNIALVSGIQYKDCYMYILPNDYHNKFSGSHSYNFFPFSFDENS